VLPDFFKGVFGGIYSNINVVWGSFGNGCDDFASRRINGVEPFAINRFDKLVIDKKACVYYMSFCGVTA